eukprot:1367599-Rhodomonas_salina.1
MVTRRRRFPPDSSSFPVCPAPDASRTDREAARQRDTDRRDPTDSETASETDRGTRTEGHGQRDTDRRDHTRLGPCSTLFTATDTETDTGTHRETHRHAPGHRRRRAGRAWRRTPPPAPSHSCHAHDRRQCAQPTTSRVHSAIKQRVRRE